MLTSFLRIMVVLGKRLKDHRKEISDVVLSFQKATRTLQHICAHGKVEKEQRMVDFVPKVKKNLELLLFKVKGMLEANGMGQAFWLGTRE
jgi:Fanconi anemia group D2 protein